MRILCAPDSFKETLDAPAAAEAMAQGARAEGGQAETCPVADGGEGTLEALLIAGNGRRESVPTLDPLGRPIQADIGFLPEANLAVIEMAAASGLGLLSPQERNPLRTSSFGTGQLIAIAAREASRILLAVGGTATVDGGCGLLQALGARFLGQIGEPLEDLLTGGGLTRIASIETPVGLPMIDVAVDVDVPLLGEHGAARLFGPQKGADPSAVAILDAGLLHLADLLDPDGVLRCHPGTGAAGGAAFGLHAALDARLCSGIDLVLDAIRFDERARDADMLIVGEGCLDEQSLRGKAAIVTARRASHAHVVAVCGRVGAGWEAALREQGGPIDSVVSLVDRFGEQRAMQATADCVRDVVAELTATAR